LDKRTLKVIVNKAGGTAGKESLNYKMSVPSAWAKQLGITKEDREIVAEFDGDKIVIQKKDK